MHQEGEISMNEAGILATISEIPICRKIVTFFLRNVKATDTARGVAEWWVQEDLQATQDALDRLVEIGIVLVRTRGGRNFYSFTEDRVLQQSLRKILCPSASQDPS